MVLMNFRLNKKIRDQFHIYCIQNDTTMADLIREFVTNKLNGTQRVQIKKGNIESDWRDKTWEDSF